MLIDKERHGEAKYLQLISDILNFGEVKENRTGVDTLVVPPMAWSHDMSLGFPLFQSKHMAKKTMLVELEGFIGGITDKKWFQERGCRIWNEWSNADTRPFDVKQEDWDDLGPIYGYNWRAFGEDYDGNVNRGPMPPTSGLDPSDQLSSIVQKLRVNPNDRRMVCSAWNPPAHHEMALPPCHVLWNVTHINGKLNLHWHQRSCDMFLGVPFNIASYAMLLTLLCKEAGMQPGQLSATFCDAHIYVNHKDQCTEQIDYFMNMAGAMEEVSVAFKDWTDIFSWKHDDTLFHNHVQGPKIKAPIAV